MLARLPPAFVPFVSEVVVVGCAQDLGFVRDKILTFRFQMSFTLKLARFASSLVEKTNHLVEEG